jgi:hypothetical protein
MTESNRAMAPDDVVAITQIINLYGVAVDSQRGICLIGFSLPMSMRTSVSLCIGGIWQRTRAGQAARAAAVVAAFSKLSNSVLSRDS